MAMEGKERNSANHKMCLSALEHSVPTIYALGGQLLFSPLPSPFEQPRRPQVPRRQGSGSYQTKRCKLHVHVYSRNGHRLLGNL